MQKFIFYLFAIPTISFVIIAVYQVLDEMFKKKFILERRATPSDSSTETPKRRYLDSVPPGVLRNPDTATAEKSTEVAVPQVNGV